MKKTTLFFAGLFLLGGLLSFVSAEKSSIGSKVLLVPISSTVNPATSEFIQQNIKRGEKEKFEAVIIELDTPGGLLTSTRSIVKAMLNADVPVIVYVAPSGAHAGSAGVFITMAGHIAAMAPGTNIGAAHPVSGQGEDPEKSGGKHLAEKIEQDTIAFIRGIADKRGRNEQWAEDAVKKSVSITSKKALKLNVVNILADNVDDLLKQSHGRTVELVSGKHTVNTKDVTIVRASMSLGLKFLDIIGNPTIAYLLMSLGGLGLYFELSNPGAIFPGVIGGLALVLAFIALQALPINYGALLLIAAALILFILEVWVVSYGLLTIAGAAAFIIGGVLLFESPDEAMRVPLKYILSIGLSFAAIGLFMAYEVVKGQMRQQVTGLDSLAGEYGEALGNVAPGEKGKARIMGEFWDVVNEGEENLTAGDSIVIVSNQGMLANVKKSQRA